MMLVLTCALCATEPALLSSDVGAEAAALRDVSLSPQQLGAPRALPAAVSLARADGSGGGDGHSDHMGPMWIVMGVMMAVMMVGMGVYLMRHGAPAQTLGSATSPPPAQAALPVSATRAGGG